jgi:hypothetical protein
MSPIVFLAICILGCDALLYFLFQWTYGEKRRGLAGKSDSNRAKSKPQHSQPLEFVSARSPHRFAGSRHKGVGASRQNENVTTIRQTERLAYQQIATSLSDAKR